MSDMSEDIESQPEKDVLNAFGIYFCTTCRNILTPGKPIGGILEFNCPLCGTKQIDFSKRKNENCMLYSKELAGGSKRYYPDINYIFDPTIPRVQITCPECDHDEAVYMLTPDDGERKLLVRLICTNSKNNIVKCGNIWDLDENDSLYKDFIQLDQNQF